MKYFTVIFCSVFILFSCNIPRYVYTPASANLLHIEEKADVKVAANFASAGELIPGDLEKDVSRGIDVQAAAAITKRLAIRADAYQKWERNQSVLNINNNQVYEQIVYRKKGAGVSIGCYNFSKNKASSAFQLYAGYGTGYSYFKRVDNGNSPAVNNYAVDFNTFFLQPEITAKAKKVYSATLTLKFLLVNYKNIRTDFPDIGTQVLGDIDQKNSFFTDFVVQHRFVFKSLPIQFHLQHGVTGLNTRFTSKQYTDNTSVKYDYRVAWLAFGVAADINSLFKK